MAKKPKLATEAGLKGKVLTARDRFTDAASPDRIREAWRAFERKTGLTRSGQVAALACFSCWLIAYFIAGTGMYIFSYGIFLLALTSFFLARRRLKLEGSREGLFPRAQEGDRLDVEVRLTAKRGVSTFVLEERVPERLGTTVKVPIAKLSRNKSVTHHYGLRCARRGVYEVGPLVAVSSDPLGLARHETKVADKFELLVHPRVEYVEDRPLTRRFEDPPIRPPRSKPWPSGLEFYGMREYVPGDDLRRIVWRASARTGRLMVREAEEGITDHITVILDTDRGSHSWDGDHSESFETGVRAAASIAYRHLGDGYEVRSESNAGPLTRALRGRDKTLSVLDAYARVDLSREPLTKVIMRLVADPRRDAHNILVTPKLGVAEAAQLRILLNKGVSILVVALIWAEENAETLGVAASLGCQVTGVHPGQDIGAAMSHDIGAGNR